MIAGLVVFVLGFAAAAFVLAPLFRADAATAERIAGKLSEEQDLASQRDMAVGALRDLEEDRATGKIGDADYEDLKARLSNVAVAAMKRIDELEPTGPRRIAAPTPDSGS